MTECQYADGCMLALRWQSDPCYSLPSFLSTLPLLSFIPLLWRVRLDTLQPLTNSRHTLPLNTMTSLRKDIVSSWMRDLPPQPTPTSWSWKTLLLSGNENNTDPHLVLRLRWAGRNDILDPFSNSTDSPQQATIFLASADVTWDILSAPSPTIP